jgi:hypothetical protein
LLKKKWSIKVIYKKMLWKKEQMTLTPQTYHSIEERGKLAVFIFKITNIRTFIITEAIYLRFLFTTNMEQRKVTWRKQTSMFIYLFLKKKMHHRTSRFIFIKATQTYIHALRASYAHKTGCH